MYIYIHTYIYAYLERATDRGSPTHSTTAWVRRAFCFPFLSSAPRGAAGARVLFPSLVFKDMVRQCPAQPVYTPAA